MLHSLDCPAISAHWLFSILHRPARVLQIGKGGSILKQVRVRFAPSPTGELHVGGARTALFNWLLARKHNGVFILRIEDTDIARSSEEMTRHILEGMEWLGLSWDEGPFYQSNNREQHVAYAMKCLNAGAAYYDFSDPESIAKQREAAQKSGKAYRYDRSGMEPDIEKARRRIVTGEQAAVRFLVPPGETTYRDLVHGDVSFLNEKIEDFVLLRGDGTPTYMLSVVADDASMGVTHVVRGDDHIANTPKQILLYKALGHQPPEFAHLPLILGPDKKKLSKRHGGTSLAHYKEQGYLPKAMFNFLALLGWASGDDTEIFSPEELIGAFSFDGVGKSSAVFDTDKLEWINSQWINRSSVEDLIPYVRSEMDSLGIWIDDLLEEKKEWFIKVVELLKDRSRRTWDIARSGTFFFRAPQEYDAHAVKKFCKGESLPGHIHLLAKRLTALPSWNREKIEAELRSLAEELGIGAGKLIHPLRIGTTGLGVTPDVFTIAELLGQEEVVTRLDQFAQYLETESQ